MTISPAKCLVVDMCFFPESALAETSFCMQYKKSQRGLLREAFRGEGEGVNGCKCRGEEKGEDRSWKKMMSRRCVSARADSAKNTCLLLAFIDRKQWKAEEH